MNHTLSRHSNGFLHSLRRIVFGRIRLSKKGALHLSFGEPSRRRKAASSTREQAEASSGTKKKALPAAGNDSAGMLMHSELCIHLNANPENRVRLRHLSFFEAMLAKRGSSVFADLRLDILRKAHSQIELLAGASASPGLLSLAAKMAAVLVQRGGIGATKRLDSPPSDFGAEVRAEVSEVPISRFDAAVEYELTRPAPL